MAENTWVLCGKPDNWNIALKDGLWGLVPKGQGKWRFLKQGDLLYFYANSPVTGVIGVGRLQTKFKQNVPLWPDEISKKEVLYPFRFEFQPEYVLPETEWKTRKIKVSLPIGFYSGTNLLDDQDIIDELKLAIKKEWDVDIQYQMEPKTNQKVDNSTGSNKVVDLSHDKVKDMIFEIGKSYHYMADKEYEINSDRLDVVWRRVEKSVPTYAFEIQIGGDIYHALGKLKHAYDLWNSNIFIVIDERHRTKVDELLSGTFHEITNVIRVINLNQINSLYALQTDDVKLRKQLGLP